jgi:hypothetical protein
VIHILYSLVRRGQDLPEKKFYSRQISYPVMVTVYHMLECDAMDILPYTYTDMSDASNEDDTKSSLKDILRVDDQFGWCLFSVEVRNTYGLPFDVIFERSQEGRFLCQSVTSKGHIFLCRSFKPLSNEYSCTWLDATVSLHEHSDPYSYSLSVKHCDSNQKISLA